MKVNTDHEDDVAFPVQRRGLSKSVTFSRLQKHLDMGRPSSNMRGNLLMIKSRGNEERLVVEDQEGSLSHNQNIGQQHMYKWVTSQFHVTISFPTRRGSEKITCL